MNAVWQRAATANFPRQAIFDARLALTIRHHGKTVQMTLQDFAARFGVTHPSVMKWEKQADEPTRMSWSTEKDLRLFGLLQAEGETRIPAAVP